MPKRSVAKILTPELKGLFCLDLDRGNYPSDSEDCALVFQADIGVKGEKGADIFTFTVVTPRALAVQQLPQWGRGLLIVPEFSWKAVEGAVNKLLSHYSGASWHEIAQEINKELFWEYDNYKS